MLEKAIAEETLVTEKERINKAVAKQVSQYVLSATHPCLAMREADGPSTT